MLKRKILIVLIVFSGFLFILALPRMVVTASPAAPITFVITQPDGTTFEAIQWGDENMNGYETLEGYAIAQQSVSGVWYYLTAATNGTLAPAMLDSSLMIVGQDEPVGLKKHLRPAQNDVSSSFTRAPEVISSVDSPPSTGTHKVAVFLVGFPNATGRTDPADWANLIFGGFGSLEDYYETVSHGALDIIPASETSGVANDGIIGWLDLSAYYDGHPNPGTTVSNINKYITKRALQVGDANINFADFDTNGNGSISSDELHIIVVVAGYERSYGGVDVPAVWAHNSDLSGTVGAPTLDGKILVNGSLGGYYSQVGEYHSNHIATMGVIAHNFGHDLRWPDLYDIDDSSVGVGNWSVMGTGLWNGLFIPGNRPAFPDAWLRWYSGWLTPTTISGYSLGQTISDAESTPTAFLLRPNPDAVDWLYMQHSGQGEYFLIENRQQTSYDVALPGCGLLIWHVDETVRSDNYANATETHPLVKLIEADGLDQLKFRINRGDGGDPFPGTSTNRHFTLYSTPNSKLYNGTDSFVRATYISNCAATMTADLLHGYPIAALTGLNPPYSMASSEGLTLKVYGSDFYSNSVVRWNGLDRTTYYVSPNELHAIITGLDMAALTAGPDHTADVTVFNPQPGGGESSIKEFAVIDLTTIVPRSFLSWVQYNYLAGPAYVIKKAEYFESTLVGWEILESGTDDYKWGRRDCRPYAGAKSAWAVGDGTNGFALACGSNYPNYANTSLAYGPFSTEGGIQNGQVKFRMFINSEPGFDYLWILADIGGDTEHGYKVSGNSGGWIEGTLNLNNVDGLGFSVIGYPKVWFRFRFTSDYLVSTGEGAFVDDVILRVCYASSCSGTYGPALAPMSISSPGDLLIEPVIIDLEP